MLGHELDSLGEGDLFDSSDDLEAVAATANAMVAHDAPCFVDVVEGSESVPSWVDAYRAGVMVGIEHVNWNSCDGGQYVYPPTAGGRFDALC
jgi:hypothetical protein